jgi:hypothetical protein
VARSLVAAYHAGHLQLVVLVRLISHIHGDLLDRAAGKCPGLASRVVVGDGGAAVTADVQAFATERELAELGAHALELPDLLVVDVQGGGADALIRHRGVADVSFATSYGALYAYARDTGLYSERLTRLWPLLLDGAFIVAQLAAILAGILRGSRGWPILTMLLTGALTVWFNLQHAGADPGRRLAAALPPVLMMLAFEIDIQIVKWVMQALGKPLGPIAPPPPDGMVPGAVWRSDGLDWNVPPPGLSSGWPPDANGPVPAGHHLPENPQNGQTGLPTRMGRERAGVTKRQRIEAYLDRLDPEQLQNLTVRELTAELANEGLEVTERYVKHVLDQRRPTSQPRRRGSGTRRPRR